MTARENIWMRPQRPARGPQPSFSRERLTRAAIEIADAEGLEAITMRRLAAAIGAGTMSLYRYVSGKDDVIDLMVDAVAAEFFPPGLEPAADWRTGLAAFARRSRETMLRHPWLAPLAVGRNSSGPNQIRTMERALELVDGLGLTMDEMLTVVGAVMAYVSGYVQSELAQAEVLRRTGMDPAQWMATQLPFIRSVLATGEFPLFGRMMAEGGRTLTDPAERFGYGLDRLLDGIAADLARRDAG